MKIADILTGKKILIWGYGREGKSTEHFILDHNIDCEYDIFEGKYEDIDCDKYDIIVKSPGIKCHEDNIKFTSQTELMLAQFAKNIIGITRAVPCNQLICIIIKIIRITNTRIRQLCIIPIIFLLFLSDRPFRLSIFPPINNQTCSSVYIAFTLYQIFLFKFFNLTTSAQKIAGIAEGSTGHCSAWINQLSF